MKFQNPKVSKFKESGVAALPTIVIISMIILVVGIGVASSGFVEGLSSFGELENKKALFAAEAGAMDAFKRIGKNINCNSGGTPNCSNYSLIIGDATAMVSVSGSGVKTIISNGQVGFKKAKIQVIVSIDANGKITQTSWQQLTN
ncbi:hypothetical protein HZC33_00350 [Candidatus Wolfebacteria bacterium]|nr:hypothetical protein [Candidatus Wolfebacteria bacterium]